MNERPEQASDEQSQQQGEQMSASKPPMSREELDKVLEEHRTWLETEGNGGKQADLSEANLENADLSGAHLRKAYMRGCSLQGANLNNAILSEANLNRADLQRASLFGANLSGASLLLTKLHRADLQGADLYGANLNRADLEKSHLFRAKFHSAKLNSANFQGALLSRAEFLDASLIGANLKEALLIATIFQGADLQEANFQGADLQEAKFQGANLSQTDFELPKAAGDDKLEKNNAGPNLKATNLKDASFQHSNLSDARLSDVTGLQSHQLAGANLSNAKLPKDIRNFDGLHHVEELSKHARAIFLGLIGSCVFSWLTIATTTDVALLTSSTNTPLPIIQTKVPIAGFYLAAPVILLALYCYLHLYLQNLWESLARLPAIFPNGRKLNRQAYPWLITGLIRRYVPLLTKDKPTFFKAKFIYTVVSVWMLVPFTLALFWFRYLPRQHWIGLALLTLILLLAIWLGTVFFQRASTALRGDPLDSRLLTPKLVTPVTVAALVTVGISLLIVTGKKQSTLELLGYHLYADLQETNVSTKPANWTGVETEKEYQAQIAQVKGAQLACRKLRFADARGAFLVKANLTGADLTGANLTDADLTGADLTDADLTGANLYGTDLRQTIFWPQDKKDLDLIQARDKACKQLKSAVNWRAANLDKNLDCSEPTPKPQADVSGIPEDLVKLSC